MPCSSSTDQEQAKARLQVSCCYGSGSSVTCLRLTFFLRPRRPQCMPTVNPRPHSYLCIALANLAPPPAFSHTFTGTSRLRLPRPGHPRRCPRRPPPAFAPHPAAADDRASPHSLSALTPGLLCLLRRHVLGQVHHRLDRRALLARRGVVLDQLYVPALPSFASPPPHTYQSSHPRCAGADRFLDSSLYLMKYLEKQRTA